MKKEKGIETVVRDLAECHNAFAAWVVIYNTASSVPGALLVHYIEDRCWRLDLYSGIFLWYGRLRNGSLETLYIRDREAEKGRDKKAHFL